MLLFISKNGRIITAANGINIFRLFFSSVTKDVFFALYISVNGYVIIGNIFTKNPAMIAIYPF
jgi:hypothetical protein